MTTVFLLLFNLLDEIYLNFKKKKNPTEISYLLPDWSKTAHIMN